MSQRQLVKLEPESELKFRGPFTNVIATHLKLTNVTDKAVLFKVKTTAPKRYCVRPNSGLIKPHETTDIAVILQPFTYDPQDKNKHKFMVQSMLAPEDVDNLDAVFKNAAPENITDSKLKCVFEMPEEHQEVKIVNSTNLSSVPSVSSTTLPERVGKSLDPPTDREKIAEELNRLREENQRLKDQEVRLKKLALSDSMRSSHLPTGSEVLAQHNANAGGVLSSMPPLLHLVLALILGLIIGKCVL